MRTAHLLSVVVICLLFSAGYCNLLFKADTGDDTEKDPCQPNPCQNGGLCSKKEPTGYECRCPETHDGDICQNEKDPCKQNPCQNGGTCKKTGSTKYECQCPASHDGDNCQNEKDPCKQNPCQNGGTCKKTESTKYECQCPASHDGDNCQNEKGPCEPNPCQNGGTCSKKESAKYECRCPTNYDGDHCQNACDLKCGHGTCLFHNHSQICVCDDGYALKGKACEECNMHCGLGTCYYDKNRMACKCDVGAAIKERTCVDCKKSCGAGTCAFVKNEEACYCPAGTKPENEYCVEKDPCESNPCKNGGTCSKIDGLTFECLCSENHTGKNCEQTKNPCETNKCGDNGKCVVITPITYNCTCNKGYSFDNVNCDTITWCDEVGNKLCPDKCKFNDGTKSGYCDCGENKYFSFESGECEDLTDCPLIKCEETEECREGKCECKEHYAPDDKGKCQRKKYCQIDASAPNTCIENPTDPENPYYICKDGFYYDGHSCEVSTCDVPGKSKCSQICTLTGDKEEECDCENPFTLENNKCKLKEEFKCDKKSNCNVGECYKEGDKQHCACPTGYKRNTAEDGCVIIDEYSLCAGNNFDYKENKCNCSGHYKLAKDKITCELMRCSDKAAQKTCQEIKGKCHDMSTMDKGFDCGCLLGYEKHNGICTEICEIESYQSNCLKEKKACKVILDSGEAKHVCVCPPGFEENKHGECRLSKNFYLISLPVVKTQDLTELPAKLALDQQVSYAMKTHFPYLQEADVLQCSDNSTSWMCSLELRFSAAPSEESMQVLRVLNSCISINISKDQCYLPPNLVLQKNDFAKIEVSKSNLCSEAIKDYHCGNLAECKDNKCYCKSGFNSRPEIIDDEYTILKCVDIDECKLANNCTGNSKCINVVGDYYCECKPGNIKSGNDKFAKNKEKCIDLCHPGACGKGRCKKKGDFAVDCSCFKGYTGSFCDRADATLLAAVKATKIVGAVLGVFLGLSLIALFLMYRRFKKNKFSQNFSPTARGNDSEMMERRHMRQGVSNKGYE